MNNDRVNRTLMRMTMMTNDERIKFHLLLHKRNQMPIIASGRAWSTDEVYCWMRSSFASVSVPWTEQQQQLSSLCSSLYWAHALTPCPRYAVSCVPANKKGQRRKNVLAMNVGRWVGWPVGGFYVSRCPSRHNTAHYTCGWVCLTSLNVAFTRRVVVVVIRNDPIFSFHCGWPSYN